VCSWPRLPVCPRSLDLRIEFGEAGIAKFNRNVTIANLVLPDPHAVLL
jgi:hypothetical protein